MKTTNIGKVSQNDKQTKTLSEILSRLPVPEIQCYPLPSSPNNDPTHIIENSRADDTERNPDTFPRKRKIFDGSVLCQPEGPSYPKRKFIKAGHSTDLNHVSHSGKQELGSDHQIKDNSKTKLPPISTLFHLITQRNQSKISIGSQNEIQNPNGQPRFNVVTEKSISLSEEGDQRLEIKRSTPIKASSSWDVAKTSLYLYKPRTGRKNIIASEPIFRLEESVKLFLNMSSLLRSRGQLSIKRSNFSEDFYLVLLQFDGFKSSFKTNRWVTNKFNSEGFRSKSEENRKRIGALLRDGNKHEMILEQSFRIITLKISKNIFLKNKIFKKMHLLFNYLFDTNKGCLGNDPIYLWSEFLNQIDNRSEFLRNNISLASFYLATYTGIRKHKNPSKHLESSGRRFDVDFETLEFNVEGLSKNRKIPRIQEASVSFKNVHIYNYRGFRLLQFFTNNIEVLFYFFYDQ